MDEVCIRNGHNSVLTLGYAQLYSKNSRLRGRIAAGERPIASRMPSGIGEHHTS